MTAAEARVEDTDADEPHLGSVPVRPTFEPVAVDAVPSRAGSAALVLATVDDPESAAADVARAVGTDPALTSRVLALANSGYYGLSRRVATAEFAVSVIGFDVVRSLALTQATGLDRPGAVPAGFWEQAALSATAAATIAPMFGAPRPDAFCLGLLHTLGSALLNQVAPLPALCLPEPADLAAFAQAETDLYGVGHAELGARTLAQWHFPPEVCDMIAHHHDDILPDAGPLARALQAARLLTSMIVADPGESDCGVRELERVSQGRLAGTRTNDPLPTLLDQIVEQSAGLQHGLAAG